MNICVFDTETTSLDKPFCYDVGFLIYDTEQDKILIEQEYCIEQIWHNMPLFATAYYADKRPVYVKAMRARKIRLDKWGYVMQRMARLFEEYEVKAAFAYNANFDERVFNFNCDWFKTINPFDTVPIFDIRGYVHSFIAFTLAFQNFCEKNKRFTESGNYSTTAETVYQYISGIDDFEEEHTALSDAKIELVILQECVSYYRAEYAKEYKVYQSIPRRVQKTLTIYDKRFDEEVCAIDYEKIRINREKTQITIS